MAENYQNSKKKRGLPLALTIIAYALIILGLLIIAPVVCPPVFGYHTYTVASDESGEVGASGVLVYAKATDSYKSGNLIAVDNEDDDRDVDVCVVESSSDSTVTVSGGKTVDADLVLGKVRARTPFFGYLCQLCFSVVGIVITVALFVVGLILMMIANSKAKKENQKEFDYNN
ncbi:MAG: hypothetical protein E7282_11720 [Lachnospiraceae bacterium]|nr:hypothetical protein [Lachnospiraceae bacterium]